MDISVIIDKLNKEYACNIASEYYGIIDEWTDWWRGYFKPFHQFTEYCNGKAKTRELFSVKMAKKICEDWAAILLNEKTEIVIGDKKSSVFVLGEDGNGGVLAENSFWQQGNALVEKAFFSGTGAFVLKLHNVAVKADGGVIKSKETKIGIDYIYAKHIVPLSVVQGKITEVAFVSEVTEKGSNFVYLETHTVGENGNYIIKNRYYKNDSGVLTEQPLPTNMAERIDTGSDIPWFALVYPNIVNNIINNNNLGISVYANAIDCLKGVDLAFNNLCRDFKLGGKKVFYNKDLLQYDAEGRAVTPDDVAQQLFYTLGDDLSNETQITEHNPDLRVEDNKNGIQAQLDYLSFKCGLGTHYYQFQNNGSGKIMTATEYVGSKQDLVQNANKHYLIIEQAVKALVRAVLYAGKEFCGVVADPDTEVCVNFEDGFIVDKDSQRERDRQDVLDGIMLKYEYRMKWYGETEEEAKAVLAAESADENSLMFGGD